MHKIIFVKLFIVQPSWIYFAQLKRRKTLFQHINKLNFLTLTKFSTLIANTGFNHKIIKNRHSNYAFLTDYSIHSYLICLHSIFFKYSNFATLFL